MEVTQDVKILFSTILGKVQFINRIANQEWKEEMDSTHLLFVSKLKDILVGKIREGTNIAIRWRIGNLKNTHVSAHRSSDVSIHRSYCPYIGGWPTHQCSDVLTIHISEVVLSIHQRIVHTRIHTLEAGPYIGTQMYGPSIHRSYCPYIRIGAPMFEHSNVWLRLYDPERVPFSGSDYSKNISDLHFILWICGDASTDGKVVDCGVGGPRLKSQRGMIFQLIIEILFFWPNST